MDLSLNFSFGSCLLETSVLDALPAVLCRGLPGANRFRVRGVSYRLADSGALRAAVEEENARKGPWYAAMAKERPGDHETRRFGHVSFRIGRLPQTFVMISFDDHVIAKAGESNNWGNWVSLGLAGYESGDEALAHRARDLFVEIAEQACPVYAHGHEEAEFHHKNLITEGGGIRARAYDAPNRLPGLYWMNYFGRELAQRIGEDKLLSQTVFECCTLSGGVFLRLWNSPEQWNTRLCVESERALRNALGRQLFIDYAW